MAAVLLGGPRHRAEHRGSGRAHRGVCGATTARRGSTICRGQGRVQQGVGGVCGGALHDVSTGQGRMGMLLLLLLLQVELLLRLRQLTEEAIAGAGGQVSGRGGVGARRASCCGLLLLLCGRRHSGRRAAAATRGGCNSRGCSSCCCCCCGSCRVVRGRGSRCRCVGGLHVWVGGLEVGVGSCSVLACLLLLKGRQGRGHTPSVCRGRWWSR
mmetsp:Transcript_3504/g.9382  ORF Transcript_3504/g.9382 Transcript_3504/m.9382 type:complete len:212 (-) Transcript_3504:1770-2405(-)